MKFQSRTSGNGSNNAARLEVPIKMGSLVVGQSVEVVEPPSTESPSNSQLGTPLTIDRIDHAPSAHVVVFVVVL